MKATIKLKFEENGAQNEHQATFEGERWTSDHEYTASFLNQYAANWQLSSYYPDPVIGTALEVVAALKDSLGAEFVEAEEVEESDAPAEAQF